MLTRSRVKACHPFINHGPITSSAKHRHYAAPFATPQLSPRPAPPPARAQRQLIQSAASPPANWQAELGSSNETNARHSPTAPTLDRLRPVVPAATEVLGPDHLWCSLAA